MGFWCCMDNYHDLLYFLHGHSITTRENEAESSIAIHPAIGVKYNLESNLFLLPIPFDRFGRDYHLNSTYLLFPLKLPKDSRMVQHINSSLCGLALHCNITKSLYSNV